MNDSAGGCDDMPSDLTTLPGRHRRSAGRAATRLLTALLACGVAAACSSASPGPAAGPPSAPATTPGPVPSVTRIGDATPAPAWLGTRVLPVGSNGFAAAQDTPPELRNRSI